MPRPKNPTYEYIKSKDLYRKRIKGPDGKWIAIYAKTPKELSAKIRVKTEQLANEEYAKRYPTLASYVDVWFDAKKPQISDATAQDYKFVIESYIKPLLGSMELGNISLHDAETARNALSGKSRSLNRKFVMILKNVMKYAIKNGIIANSACLDLSPGGKESEEKKALTDQQVSALYEAIADAKTHILLFVRFALNTGMRREELLALRWENVFLTVQHPYVFVDEALRGTKNQPVISKVLKNKQSRRKIFISDNFVQYLRQHKDTATSEYVFPNTNGNPMTETQFRNMWNSVICRMNKPHTYTRYINGQKIVHTIDPQNGHPARNHKYKYLIDFHVTPHILRHTYITNLIRNGMNIKQVQQQAGHDDIKTTLKIYAHVQEDQEAEIASQINSNSHLH